MAMAANSGAGLTNEPNVTPMIDVLLVLLIIFMMIIPMSRKAIDVQLPDPTPSVQPANQVSNQIVLEVVPGATGADYLINKQKYPADRLQAGIKEIYDPRPEKIIFIKGDPTVTFQDVIFAMDAARGGGVLVIGAAPKEQPAGAPAAAAKKGKKR